MEKEDKARLDDIYRRFTEVGVEAISPEETLELLFSYASPRSDNRALSRELLRKYASLKNLLSASLEQLRNDGLGESQAVLLTLIAQIGRQIFLEYMEKRPCAFVESADIGRYFLELARGQSSDALYALCLDGETFLACYSLTDGGALPDDTDARRAVVRRTAELALTSAANTVVLCRRVSGGLLVPAVSDHMMIERLRAALDTLRVHFRDYFLVTDNDFVSLLETGAMERPLEIALFPWEIGESENGTL